MTDLVRAFEGRRDEEGRLVLGDPRRGCRHCATVEMKVSRDEHKVPNNKAVLYHPGVECCAGAIRDQIRYRSGEIEALQKRMKQDEEHVNRLSEEADMYGRDSKSQQAHTARWREERALKGQTEKKDLYREEISKLGKEISRLKRLLEAKQ